MVFKTLNISGVLLDRNQLMKYMEKIAVEHSIKTSSDKNTYPIYSLNENYKFIYETYKILNEHIKLGIKIHSAGEWILDNFYIIEEIVKTVRKELSLKKYMKMIGIASGKYEGFSRSYVLASEIVSYTDCKLDGEVIYSCLEAYQKNKMLSIEEIANIGVFLKIAVIAHIKEICEKIFSSQLQRFKVEEIIERLVEKKDIKERVFINKFESNSSFENELKYPFIEYMSYRLKKYGKFAGSYQLILEEEVLKLGITVSEVIQKEHLYIANLKITIGNCIKSLRDISRINFSELLGEMNGTEEILSRDIAGIYSQMDLETKNYYKSIIEKISKETKISEIYIAEKIIELSRRYENEINYEDDIEEDSEEIKILLNEKKKHVGYYLLDEGLYELKAILLNKKIKIKSQNYKTKLYIGSFFAISLYIDFLISILIFLNTTHVLLTVFFSVITWIPISEIVIRVMNYFMSKFKSPTMIPKMDFEDKIPDDRKTFVVIPTILKNRDKVKEMIRKLEVYYLANYDKNIYFALLGDVSEEDCKIKDFDKVVVDEGIKEIKKLNKKYKAEGFERFHFLYRNRVWNDGENKFIGWERKRGLLVTFNEYIKKRIPNNFNTNTIESQKKLMPDFKYIITLDSDTNLVLNSASKLIGAMSHILNRPIIYNKKVISGYGIMQPRIGLDLSLAKKSKFIEIYSIPGGIDFYTNAISDIYQDYFKEGIFTGKGIYDIDVYNEILENEIPENTVLSHDLLEGNFLRCGLITDVMLLDGYPLKYISYIKRNHRWVRGDFQIIRWLKSKRLNEISKFKIFDNLRRSLLKVFSLIGIISSIFLFRNNIIFGGILLGISLISITIMYLLDVINYIIFKESNIREAVYSHKKFSKDIGGMGLNFLKIFLEIIFLPYEAYENLDATIRSFYRMTKKKKLLEWVTAEDGDKNIKNNIFYVFKEMFFNILIGIICILFGNLIFKIIGILFVIAPSVSYKISEEKNEKLIIKDSAKKELSEIGFRTWKFFEDHITEKNNYLITDNYQEDRKEKIVNRTSSTNIGLELLSIISAYDLKYINFEKAIEYLKKVINTVKILSKWNGHLYNWYTIDTLEPLKPRYISTVDSGNFIGYLYIVKEFVKEHLNSEELQILYNDIQKLIDETDFSKLYSEKNKLFSIGFNLEENELTDSYYDFLASEARQASIVAISKRQVPAKHWNALSRTITIFKGYKGLISWTGTAFEYLMPNINLKRYKGSLIDESSKFAILSQKEYCKRLGVPWGISESAFNLRDLNYNYQYKAFGIPWLGLKRGLEYDLVISPYSTFLAFQDGEKTSMENIRELKKCGAYDEYGFYESIDFTSNRLKKDEKYSVVKTYMAHHQGLILNSINNVINDNILQKRFNSNPEIEAVEILLEERMPKEMIITKEKKERPERPRYSADSGYIEQVIEKPNKLAKNYNVISNENYKIIIDDFALGYSEYKDNLINQYKPGYEISQGMFFYIKNLKTKKILSFNKNAKVIFMPDKAKYIIQDGSLKATMIITLNSNKPVEFRRVEIENMGSNEEIFEVIFDFIPILSSANNEYAHPAFNNMFLKFDKVKDDIIIERRSRNLDKFLYLATSLYTEDGKIVDASFEINKEKYLGRNNFEEPSMIKESKNFSNDLSYSINKILAQKQVLKIDSKSKVNVNCIISVSEDKDEALKNLNESKSEEEILKIFEISRVRMEEEMKYLQISSENSNIYQELLKYILEPNISENINLDINKDYEINSLWKFGISGDIPIITVKVKNLTDIDNLEEIIEAYMFYRIKKIYVDLVILNEESNVYERFVRDSIEGIISDKQINYLKNIKSGVFVLNTNELEKEDIETIELKSKIIIQAEKGGIRNFLKEQTNNRKIKKVKNKIIEKETEILPKREEDLLFFNEYGGFSLDGKEYRFAVNFENKLPTVWSNIIANKMFGTVVTENMNDIIWNKNSRLNRISAWNNDTVLNIPSQIIYVRNIRNNKVWTLNSNVYPNSNYYYVTYGFGYAKYKNVADGILQETDIFVPNNSSCTINKIRFKNTSSEEKKLKVVVYLKTVLGEDENSTNGNVYIEKNKNVVYMKNMLGAEEFRKIGYITSNLEIRNFTKNKQEFFGNGNLQLPDCLFASSFENKNGIGNCVGLEFEIELNEYEEKYFSIIVGQENNIFEIEKQYNELKEIKNLDIVLNDVNKKWSNITNILNIRTPEDNLNILLNGWLIYQTIGCRIWAKSAFYQSGGAYGFRDQLQDCLGMKFIDISLLKEQIIKCAMHQFLEGDVLHWWHEETKKGSRTRFSDDLLWMPYSVCEYIKITSDYNFLDEEIEYLSGRELENDEQEIYSLFFKTDVKESLYMHCIRAIDKACDFGEHGFPKIGSGDWNDGFSNIGSKGIGESIWLGFFLYDVLNKFIKLCEYKNDEKNYKKYLEIKDKLKRALNIAGWDGRWFKRAITDDNIELGSINSMECKIDGISQSWAVISDAADNDKKYISMQELENNLVDRENNIIKLFWPGFENCDFNPGYIKAYPNGIRENGGQYTHGAIWAVIAMAKLGFGEKALEFAQIINPINHALNKESAKRYKVEPYVISADVYTNDGVMRYRWLELVYRF